MNTLSRICFWVPFLLLAGWLQANDIKRDMRLRGKVIHVNDGDTITLLVNKEKHTVRLSDVDAPEQGMPFGKEAKEQLTHLTMCKTVTVKVREPSGKYGRIIGRVFVDRIFSDYEDGRLIYLADVNRQMVIKGMAWWYPEYLSYKPYSVYEYKILYDV